MVAIITGDIIQSAKLGTMQWMAVLKDSLKTKGKTPKNWEIYRGDEFQLEVSPEKALLSAIQLKAALKSLKGVDVRMSIGIGHKEYEAAKITESNGSAFINSGRRFEELRREKLSLALKSDDEDFDRQLNLMIRLALRIMDNWTMVSAEMVNLLILNKDKSQTEIAALLNVNQSAISQRQKRAQFDLIMDLNTYYVEQIKKRFR